MSMNDKGSCQARGVIRGWLSGQVYKALVAVGAPGGPKLQACVGIYSLCSCVGGIATGPDKLLVSSTSTACTYRQ
jgi:hypothetical protein